jgi:hypothetical protein
MEKLTNASMFIDYNSHHDYVKAQIVINVFIWLGVTLFTFGSLMNIYLFPLILFLLYIWPLQIVEII